MEAESIDSVVCDPPYGLSKEPDIAEVLTHWLAGDDYIHKSRGFMGKTWDSFVPGPAVWREVYRVLKPGGHLLCFSGTRTQDLMGISLRLAGFEIRDVVQWVYGSGFPKNHAVDKAIDRMRNDDVRPVCRFLRKIIDASIENPVTIATRFGFHPRMVEHWAARDTDSQPSVPKWEQWLALKDLLSFSDEMDAEVWRLNGRKGNPGEAWHEREVIGKSKTGGAAAWINGMNNKQDGSARYTGQTEWDITAPATDDARKWAGFGSALKPAHEPILMCRKPLSESSIARNVLKNGCGAINVDASRVGTEQTVTVRNGNSGANGRYGMDTRKFERVNPPGRFPANLLMSHSPECRRIGEKRVKGDGHWTHKREIGNGNIYSGGGYQDRDDGNKLADPDGKETVEDWECTESCPVRILGEQSGERKSPADYKRNVHGEIGYHGNAYGLDSGNGYGDKGSAARFFQTFEPDTGAGFRYQSKASKRDRSSNGAVENIHPTTKSTSLMAYLVKMVTPPGGTVLDPFAGSGSTGVACVQNGFGFIGIEAEPEYVQIARARIAHCINSDKLF